MSQYLISKLDSLVKNELEMSDLLFNKSELQQNI